MAANFASRLGVSYLGCGSIGLLLFGFLAGSLSAETAPPVSRLFRAGLGASEGEGIAVGSDGVMYATGQFTGSGTFGAISLANGGAQDYWLAAYSLAGEVMWAVGAGGTAADFGSDVALDKSGDVLVAGVIQGTTNFHGVADAAGFGNKDWFLAKYSKTGVLKWVRSAGSSADDQAYSVAVDSANNYYIGGRVAGVATFGGTTVGTAGQTRVILAKYDSSGTLVWVRDVGQGGSTETCGVGIDGGGNPLVCGSSTGGTTNGPFVAKYDSNGVQVWKRVMAGNSFFDEASGVDADAAGNVYVSGRFGAAALNFGSFALDNPAMAVRGFIAKFDASGTALWARFAGSRAFDVDVAADGSAYFTGFHASNATQLGTETLPVVSGLDLWIAKFGADGGNAWVASSGTGNNDIARSIALGADGGVYVTGEAGAGIFDDPSFEPTVFIVKMGGGSTTTLPELTVKRSGANLLVSWPAGETGWVLETSETLETPFQRGQVSFTPVAGQSNAFTTPIVAPRLFIRLAKP